MAGQCPGGVQAFPGKPGPEASLVLESNRKGLRSTQEAQESRLHSPSSHTREGGPLGWTWHLPPSWTKSDPKDAHPGLSQELGMGHEQKPQGPPLRADSWGRAFSTTRLQGDERGQDSEPLKGGWGLPAETKGRQLVRSAHTSVSSSRCLLREASFILTQLWVSAQLKLTGKRIMGVGGYRGVFWGKDTGCLHSYLEHKWPGPHLSPTAWPHSLTLCSQGEARWDHTKTLARASAPALAIRALLGWQATAWMASSCFLRWAVISCTHVLLSRLHKRREQSWPAQVWSRGDLGFESFTWPHIKVPGAGAAQFPSSLSWLPLPYSLSVPILSTSLQIVKFLCKASERNATHSRQLAACRGLSKSSSERKGVA